VTQKEEGGEPRVRKKEGSPKKVGILPERLKREVGGMWEEKKPHTRQRALKGGENSRFRGACGKGEAKRFVRKRALPCGENASGPPEGSDVTTNKP